MNINKKVLFFLLLFAVACTSFVKKPKKSITSTPSTASTFDFTMKSIDDEDIALSTYKGKVVVVINTASECGLTPQYEEIEAFYKEYKDRGVEVLGFPANNFMHQEPGNNQTIKSFCTKNYGVTFQMFSKISVKGGDIHPLYQYLTQKDKNGVLDAPIKWNFQKFILDKNGRVVNSFPPKSKVSDAEFIAEIEKQLKN
jgi:glutathione peroxidase